MAKARSQQRATAAKPLETKPCAAELVEPAQNRTFSQRPRADFDFFDVQCLHDLIDHQATADDLIRTFRRDARQCGALVRGDGRKTR